MPTPPAQPVSDPWRDAEGTPIPFHSRVEQVAVDAEHGALRPGCTSKARSSAVAQVAAAIPLALRDYAGYVRQAAQWMHERAEHDE